MPFSSAAGMMTVVQQPVQMQVDHQIVMKKCMNRHTASNKGLLEH